MNTLLLGEWLNGRVAVSKTVGCVFESRLPCQIVYCVLRYTIFCCRNPFLTRNRLRLTLLFAHSTFANNAIPSLRSLRIASPLPDRVLRFAIHDFFYEFFIDIAKINNT